MTPFEHVPHAGTRAITAILLCLCLAGCAQTRSEPMAGAPPAPIDEAALAAVVAAHNGHVARLDRVHADGVVELRWIDEEGKRHVEPQVNAKVWIDLPRRTALRAEKLGEVLFWLGSDDALYWSFDLMQDDRTLTVGRHDEAPDEAPATPLLIRPLALLDLIGLTALPADPAELADASIDPATGRWVLTADGAGGPMRLWLDAGDGRPRRVEALDDEGRVLLASEVRRYVTAHLTDLSLADRPRMPTLIDIADPEGRVEIKLALDEPDGKVLDHLFDLDRLVRAMGPVRRIDAGPPAP